MFITTLYTPKTNIMTKQQIIEKWIDELKLLVQTGDLIAEDFVNDFWEAAEKCGKETILKKQCTCGGFPDCVCDITKKNYTNKKTLKKQIKNILNESHDGWHSSRIDEHNIKQLKLAVLKLAQAIDDFD